jgi:hypothetical protein
MKNVTLISSMFMNCVTVGLLVKLHTPLMELFKSHHETPPVKVSTQTAKPDPAKVLLKEAVLSQRTQIETCYDDYLKREPSKQSGSIAVKWLIGAGGHVESPAIADAELDDSELKKCVLEQVSMMTFDPGKFGENIQFSYRFHFKARAPSSIQFQ